LTLLTIIRRKQMTLSASDENFIKLNRPTIARHSFNAGTIYILVAETARLISAAGGIELVGASVAIASVLYGPSVWYMGMRTVDGFSEKGK